MQGQNYPINEWAKDDQPREKLLRKNPGSLSDVELLAILIRIGTRDKSAVQLAKEILQMVRNNLNELGRLSINELMRIKGIGEAKAITIAAALELGRRRQAPGPESMPVITNGRQVAAYLRAFLRDHNHEVFAVLFLNRASRARHVEIISQGGITATVVDPRLILKKALEQEAVSLILCHNHPSGNPSPSKADEELTRKIREAASLFDIKVLDHIIVTESGYFSFADQGML